jgi:hypothetical protein
MISFAFGTRRPRDPGIVSLATRIGAVVLARATSDPKLREEILGAARRALLGPAPAKANVG